MKKTFISTPIFFIGGISLIVVAFLTSLHDTKFFLRSYLFGFLFWSDLPLGAMGLVMIYHLTGGRWGTASRRTLEAMSETIFLIALFAIPVLIGVKTIYPWMESSVLAEPRIAHKHAYLNAWSFDLRTVIYFASWIVISHLLWRWAEAENVQGKKLYRAYLRNLSAGGLVWLGLSVTFAGIDWQMSVEPTWYSTIYGMVFAVAEALTSYAVALVVVAFAASKTKLAAHFPKTMLLDLGNIMLALVMVWAYLSFMQYLIIWSGNLPHEVIWFNHRTSLGWQWVGLFILLFQFAAPFIILLFRAAKYQATRLALIGGLIFIVRIVDHYWMLMPGFRYKPFDMAVPSALNWLGLGCVWWAVFQMKLSKKMIFATDDPDWPVPGAIMSTVAGGVSHE